MKYFVGQRVTLRGSGARGARGTIYNLYKDSSGDLILDVKMDDPTYSFTGYMLCRTFEVELL